MTAAEDYRACDALEAGRLRAALAELRKANEKLQHLLNLTERQCQQMAADRDEWRQQSRFWRQQCGLLHFGAGVHVLTVR